ncbi:MAG: hypothetical protein IT249_13905 [Chitinophagaceae bacterium]|nr:hypothetical protein [Chitinophagaceae bacterium]
MRKHFFTFLFVLISINLFAQANKATLLKSWPISITPLSIWDSDISASAGAEYRFHPSFAIRTAADYIYGDYNAESRKTSGIRLRQELRYYIAGNKLINSRAKAWPYISVALGNKWVNTKFSEWRYIYENNNYYQRWQSFHSHNREWYLMGRTGMQTAFGKQKRFLFDFSIGLGLSNNKISFSFPDGDDMRAEVTGNNDYVEASGNRYNGRFRAFNIEACFGYRLLK